MSENTPILATHFSSGLIDSFKITESDKIALIMANGLEIRDAPLNSTDWESNPKSCLHKVPGRTSISPSGATILQYHEDRISAYKTTELGLKRKSLTTKRAQ